MSKILGQTRQLLETRPKVVITTHWNPDGDAIGSSLALKHYLETLKCPVDVVIPNAVPNFLQWMPGFESAIIADFETARAKEVFGQSDLIFCLDFNAIHRPGEQIAEWIRDSNARKVMIDHHREPESWPDEIYSDIHKGSTAEMVYDFIAAYSDPETLTPEMARCLYAGIVTDSGSFRYPNTTAATHRVAAVLLERGAHPAEIHQAIYDNNSFSRLQLLGYVLNHTELMADDGLAILHLDAETMRKYNYRKGDSEGFVNYGLSVQNISVSVFFREDEDLTKCSFRSKGNVDVNTLARTYFEGGGHLNAAGGIFRGTAKEAIRYLKNIITGKQWASN